MLRYGAALSGSRYLTFPLSITVTPSCDARAIVGVGSPVSGSIGASGVTVIDTSCPLPPTTLPIISGSGSLLPYLSAVSIEVVEFLSEIGPCNL